MSVYCGVLLSIHASQAVSKEVREVKRLETATRSGVVQCQVKSGQAGFGGNMKFEGVKDNCGLVGVWRSWRGIEPHD